ncbi:protoporphyrinogen oxidase [Actinomadura rudentiformis]|uniref:Coproporphyrinogen III oxidase n=1 Tax=Actinomadura rudentiformis TaxID=359158 RepID=A0A6H9YXD0_9ACTN|nr:protoporphyrinogen oxidase [Actinomadura rudentiformis]KAB2349608.1 protoporphyrinogen oxidase [Actinomadura rudentiformis]
MTTSGRSVDAARGGAHVVVVGGGVAGLAAARFLSRGGVRVTVLEGSPLVGGKLRISEIAGLPVDEGAESMLARRPEGLDLVRDLGHGDELVNPGTTSAAILSHGALRTMPAGQVMGVPSDLRALAASQVLSPVGLARVPLDLVLPETPRGTDVSVADYVGARLGREVVDRLVEPLLGGVYAGRTEELSFESTLPAVATAARAHRSLISAARGVRDAAPKDAGPIFATLPDGLGTLPRLLSEAIVADGGTIRTSTMVRELRRRPGGWRLTLGSARAPEAMDADGVIIAVPATPAARLLAGDVPAATRELQRIEYASMAIVTLAYAVSAFPRLPRGSGYLVPAVEGREVKAVTFSSVKWPHLRDKAPGIIAVRCSIGRFGEEHTLQRADDDLKAAAMTELAATCGVSELPLETRVTRWGGGLPQYNVGHADRVARIRAAVAGQPGLAVAGAAYDGLGIPACIATARAAAARVLEHLDSRGELSHGSDGAGAGASGTGGGERGERGGPGAAAGG